MVMEFYKKSNLPEKTYYQCLVILSQFKNYINVTKEIVKDKINKDNVDDCIKEFERFVTDKHEGKVYEFDYSNLTVGAKEIYNKLLEIRNNLIEQIKITTLE